MKHSTRSAARAVRRVRCGNVDDPDAPYAGLFESVLTLRIRAGAHNANGAVCGSTHRPRCSLRIIAADGRRTNRVAGSWRT
ncbi:hypothetical protein BVI1335_190030 [Burkholderia vietnamiensis]|nr:hypothetical protein BVI1335_190030 [Burkholderia vietnamiensis]